MVSKKKKNAQVYLRHCQEDLKAMQATGESYQVAVAQANLGYALFQARKFQGGMDQFDAANTTAEGLEDLMLQVRCLGIKTLAFQSIKRLPDAYETAVSIQQLAETHNEEGIKCDALASQGQILLDSGEPIVALEKIEAALEIAEGLNDPRRLMNTLGAMGQYCITMTSPEKAGINFTRALTLAREIGDRPAEYGFLGNIGMVLTWQGQNGRAVDAFTQVLAYVQETGNEEAELQAIIQLVSTLEEMGDPESVLIYVQRGAELAAIYKEDDSLLDLYRAEILANYRLNQIEAAEDATERAINAAQASKNQEKEVDFLLSLGESAMVFEMPEKALEVYKQALKGAVRLSRQSDEAYLTGRIGVALAELGRPDEAIIYHKEAVKMAKRREIPQLEGEQLSMLALAFVEKGEVETATTYCQSAILVFTDAELGEDANQARQLLEQIR